MDTIAEMNEFMNVHDIQGLIDMFAKVSDPAVKFKIMSRINDLSGSFVEYYEHFSVDNAE